MGPALNYGFLSVKRLGVLLFPPGWDASPSHGYPQHICWYAWVKRSTVKGIAEEIENYELTQLSTFSSDPTPKLETNMVNLGKDDSISSKVIRTQTEQFLELFSRTLNFFAPERCEDIIAYYCFDRTRLF